MKQTQRPIADTAIADFLPFSSHVSTHVLKTVGGEYLMTWAIEGLPFVGREAWEIDHKHETFNRLLQGLRAPDFSNVAFWTHDVRRRKAIESAAKFDEVFHQQLSDKYFRKLSNERTLQNALYLTLVYRPIVGPRALRERPKSLEAIRTAEHAAISTMQELAGNVEAVLGPYGARRLGIYEAKNGVQFSSTLELFSFLLNRVDEKVPVLNAPARDVIATSRLSFSTRSGDFLIAHPGAPPSYGAMLTVKDYPSATSVGVLNGLKYLDFEYVITHSFSPKGRHEAMKALERTQGMMISSGDRAHSQIAELNQAMDQLASGHFVLGEYHFSIAVFADSQGQLAKNLATTRAELSNAGFVSVKEDLAVAAGFFAQFPANWKYRTRVAHVSSLNFLGLSPLHNFAMGKRTGNPWGPAITTLQTTNGQPFNFNFHATKIDEDAEGEMAIGNTMVIGKSGSGKTALVNFLLSQSQALSPAPTVFFFDKDRGAEIFVRAAGGRYLALENGAPTGFNPFQCERTEANIQFLCGLVRLLCGKDAFTAREDQDIYIAVSALLDLPDGLRTISNLQKSLPNQGDDGLYARLRKWTRGQALGWVFDNPIDQIKLDGAPLIGFDYTEILDLPEVRVPIINYLLHRLESLIDGRRLIYVMDEFWKILEGGGGLKDFARNKQKTIRKQNGLGIFATQSPEDALKSDIAAALIEQTATLVLLPNPNARREDYVDGLKLTQAEFEVVSALDERSRCFLVKQGHESAICKLDLNGLNDELAIISASTANVEILRDVLTTHATKHGVDPDLLRPGQWLPDFQARRAGARNPSESTEVEFN